MSADWLHLDLAIAALLGIYVTAGCLGAVITLLRTGGPPSIADVPLTLLIPVTGSAVDLDRLTRLLSAQWLMPHRTVFVVESADDPAYRKLQEVLARLPSRAEIFIAGPATAAAQKSHNLARALTHYDDGSRVIVLADADIAPQAHWLADIVQPLVHGASQVVSGYRWALPMNGHPATLLAVWLERAVASLPKPPWYTFAWGGSVGFAPGTLARIGAIPVLERAVSDDMSLARTARRHGIDVLYRNRLLVPTPVSHSTASFIKFGARQYQMLRLHQSAIWWNALVIVSGAMVLKSWLWWHALLGSTFWLQVLVGVLAVTYATYGVRMLRAWRIECWTVGSRWAEAALLLVPLAGPVTDLFHLAAILKGWSVKRINWAHCSYELDNGAVVHIERRPFDRPNAMSKVGGQS